MWLAPIRSGLVDQKKNDYEGAMEDWYNFLSDTKTYYGVDMSALTKSFSDEQEKYYLQVNLTFWLYLKYFVLYSNTVMCAYGCQSILVYVHQFVSVLGYFFV